jgi:CHAD domain-containing protein
MRPKPTHVWPDQATILERSKSVFASQWEELLRLRQAVMKTSELDDIHDLRVASRRFRAALELFNPFTPKGSYKELKKNVRGLTRVLGGLRNIDEAVLFFQSRTLTGLPSDSGLFRTLAKQRTRELKRIEKALKKFNHHTLGHSVRRIVAALNEDSITGRHNVSLTAYFSDVSMGLHLQVHQLSAGTTVPGHRASRHALRIAIKKWRYFLEIIAPILDRDYAPLLDRLKEYQSILGKMNDIAAFEVLLGNLKLSHADQKYFEATLKAEDSRLLEGFTELVELKPLTYTSL